VHERVPNIALAAICFVSPLVIQPVINFVTVRSWWDLHNSTLGLILALALTGSITQFVKITVGRPRPDFVDRCQPPDGATDPVFGLTNWTICTQTNNAILRDGFRSFFSGHSSLSFAGLGFLSFYLAGKMHLFDKRGHTSKAWIALAPFSAAALVAISRSMDYRHHWHDILVGSALGIVMSYFSYRQYYPSLESEFCHRPYSPRIKREDEDVLPTHIQHSQPQPHAGPSAGYQPDGSGRYQNAVNDEEYELEGTVLRHRPGSLEEMWKNDEHGPVVEERSLGTDGKEQSSSGSEVSPLPGTGERNLPRPQPQAYMREPLADNV